MGIWTFLSDTRSFLYLKGVEQNRYIPVYHGGVIKVGDAVLAQKGYEAPAFSYVMWFEPARAGHRFGCSCCTARSPVAYALAALFRARATGEAPFFQKVVVLADAAGWADVQATLANDTLTRARFKLAAEPPT